MSFTQGSDTRRTVSHGEGYWKQVDDFPSYLIREDGVIIHKHKDEFKATRLNQQGDVIVDLNRDNRRHTRKVSLLVAKAYLGDPRENFNSVIHLNGDKSDCSAINLAWRPRWFVVEYNRMFNEHPKNVSVAIAETGEEFGTLREACVKYGMVEETAYICMHNGYGVFPHGFHLVKL